MHFTFYHGLISFKCYRDTHSEDHLRSGIDAIIKIESWQKHCLSNFENKLLLLNAEQQASLPNIDDAKALYLASATTARDCGRKHEEGLAYEFMGNFFLTVANDHPEAMKCMKSARTCYMQWGAFGKAASLSKEHGLNNFSQVNSVEKAKKHSRGNE